MVFLPCSSLQLPQRSSWKTLLDDSMSQGLRMSGVLSPETSSTNREVQSSGLGLNLISSPHPVCFHSLNQTSAFGLQYTHHTEETLCNPCLLFPVNAVVTWQQSLSLVRVWWPAAAGILPRFHGNLCKSVGAEAVADRMCLSGMLVPECPPAAETQAR